MRPRPGIPSSAFLCFFREKIQIELELLSRQSLLALSCHMSNLQTLLDTGLKFPARLSRLASAFFLNMPT